MQYVVVLLVGIVGTFFWYFFSIKYKRNKFKDREDISEIDFYHLFLTQKKESKLTYLQVSMAIKYFSKHIHVSWKKMRPTDPLYLYGSGPGWDYDDELNDFLLIFRDKLTEQNSLADLIETIGDELNLVN